MRVSQAVQCPTAVFEARNLETGDEALILTSPISTEDNPNYFNLAAGWRVVGRWLYPRGSERQERTG